MSDAFERVFRRKPEAVRSAPGRVNLLGEHTDYNDGFVLPVATPQQTRVSIGRAAAPGVTVHSRELRETVRFTFLQGPTGGFGQYVFGSLREFARLAPVPPDLDIAVASDVPMNVGLSSSAALEVATLRALRALTGSHVDDVEIARMAQRAEIEYAGVRCGIMDQMAASLANVHDALFLDTRTLVTRLVALPEGASILVLDSGLPRALASSAYNQRRHECEQACQALGVRSLRDVSDEVAIARLPDLLRRRARHVITENARVLRAVGGIPADEFGDLMNASHASLRDDYEVSVPRLDHLVGLLQAHPGVFGARLTGAGFGGACVALCADGARQRVAADVVAGFNAAGGHARVLVGSDRRG